EKSVSVWIETAYSRAGPGGTGAAKCGGNYAAGLLAQNSATQNDCSQVLFLDMVEHKWIEELGGMNVCFIMANNTLVTPALNGTILPGITRHSILQLAQQMGLTIEERPYSFESLKEDARSGHLKEVFACGTAAV
ncbi:aminotransferase class IV, partial [Bartonella capreoli]